MPGGWGHLAARFFDVLLARPLTTEERREVTEMLDRQVARDAFFDQPVADQRHGYEAAVFVRSRKPDRPDLVRAALLHDIAKRHSRLGPVGRVWTSVCIRLGLPLTARMRLYRDHGTLAAAELADEDRTVTEFTRHHHGQRPEWFDADDWELLVAADRPVLSPPGLGSLIRRRRSTTMDRSMSGQPTAGQSE